MDNINEEKGINTYNEKSLHDDLKKIYDADRYEAKLGRYIIDAIKDDILIEVQTKNIYAIKNKLKDLSKNFKIILVHPIIQNKYIITENINGQLKKRKSPLKGKEVDFFKELVRCFDILDEENLTIHLYLIDVDENRIDDGKGSYYRKGISVKNRTLKKINKKIIIENKKDLIKMLGDVPKDEFTVLDLSEKLKINKDISQKICYVFKKIKLIKHIGKKGNSYIYKWEKYINVDT